PLQGDGRINDQPFTVHARPRSILSRSRPTGAWHRGRHACVGPLPLGAGVCPPQARPLLKRQSRRAPRAAPAAQARLARRWRSSRHRRPISLTSLDSLDELATRKNVNPPVFISRKLLLGQTPNAI